MNEKKHGKKIHPKPIRWFIYQDMKDGHQFLCRRRPRLTYELEFLGIIRARTLPDAKRRVHEIFN